MTQTIEAVFDGVVLRPDAPLTLDAGSRVRITVESLPPAAPYSFLTVAQSLALDGPPDWSENVETFSGAPEETP